MASWCILKNYSKARLPSNSRIADAQRQLRPRQLNWQICVNTKALRSNVPTILQSTSDVHSFSAPGDFGHQDRNHPRHKRCIQKWSLHQGQQVQNTTTQSKRNLCTINYRQDLRHKQNDYFSDPIPRSLLFQSRLLSHLSTLATQSTSSNYYFNSTYSLYSTSSKCSSFFRKQNKQLSHSQNQRAYFSSFLEVDENDKNGDKLEDGDGTAESNNHNEISNSNESHDGYGIFGKEDGRQETDESPSSNILNAEILSTNATSRTSNESNDSIGGNGEGGKYMDDGSIDLGSTPELEIIKNDSNAPGEENDAKTAEGTSSNEEKEFDIKYINSPDLSFSSISDPIEQSDTNSTSSAQTSTTPFSDSTPSDTLGNLISLLRQDLYTKSWSETSSHSSYTSRGYIDRKDGRHGMHGMHDRHRHYDERGSYGHESNHRRHYDERGSYGYDSHHLERRGGRQSNRFDGANYHRQFDERQYDARGSYGHDSRHSEQMGGRQSGRIGGSNHHQRLDEIGPSSSESAYIGGSNRSNQWDDGEVGRDSRGLSQKQFANDQLVSTMENQHRSHDMSRSNRFEGEAFDHASESANEFDRWDDGGNGRDADGSLSYRQPLDDRPLSPAETQYKSLVEQTDKLLESLSDENSSTSTRNTLQLTDFDDVMTQWSRFHSVVDSKTSNSIDGEGSGDEGTTFYSSDHSQRTRLKEGAFDQCMDLLEALERNYDLICDYSLSSIDGADGESTTRAPMHSKLMPNAPSYNLALHTLAHSGKGTDVATEAFLILERMLDRCEVYLDVCEGIESSSSQHSTRLPPPPPEPTVITFNSVLNAIAKSGANDAGHLAEEVFDKMEEWRDKCDLRKDGQAGAQNSGVKKRTYHGVLPNTRTLACLMDAWASELKQSHHSTIAPERTEAILDLAIKKRRAYVESVTGVSRNENNSFAQDNDGLDDISESDDSFQDVYDVDDVEEETLLDEMEKIPNGNLSLLSTVVPSISEDSEVTSEVEDNEISSEPATPFSKLNVVAFNTCMNVWATSGRGREGALRTNEILNRMEALAESGELDLPSEFSAAEIDQGNVEEDDSLRPNARSYSIVMNAWSNVVLKERVTGEDDATHCEDILRRMEELGAEDYSIRPNLITYITCINAWSRVAKYVDYAASRAESILNRMVDLYYSGESDLPSLDGVEERHDAPFNAVITSYARSNDPNAVERAICILRRLEASTIPATLTSYNAVMDVCAKHGMPDKALEIFEHIEDASHTGMKPDEISYNTVIDAFARDNSTTSAEKAMEFLARMEEASDSIARPTSVSYSSVINSFARVSGKEDGGLHIVQKANEVYQALIYGIESGSIPGHADPFANSCFLNCCANMKGLSSEKREALVLAITAFEDMKKAPHLHGEPNHYTYGTMMKAVSRLSSDPSERNRLMESLFTQACKRGILSQAILAQFLRNTPPHLNSKVILAMGGSKRNLPESWYSNTPPKSWPVYN